MARAWIRLGRKGRRAVPVVPVLAAGLNLGMIVSGRRKAAGLPGINEYPGNVGWL